MGRGRGVAKKYYYNVQKYEIKTLSEVVTFQKQEDLVGPRIYIK